MYSKRVRLLVQIIGFLFCTIGLLYISIQINRSMEGFQSTTASANCTETVVAGKNIWMCATDIDAQMMDSTLIKNNNNIDGVCYNSQQGYYTCLTRPPDKTFEPADGVFVDANPYDDTLPISIMNDVTGVCKDYNANLSFFSTIYLSTTALNDVISSAIGEIKYAENQLNNISTLYCATPVSPSPPLTTAVVKACTTLGSGISIFSNIPMGTNGMYNMSTTVANSLQGMLNLYNNNLAPAYKGFSVCSNIQ